MSNIESKTSPERTIGFKMSPLIWIVAQDHIRPSFSADC
jgi:hypothetical protein